MACSRRLGGRARWRTCQPDASHAGAHTDTRPPSCPPAGDIAQLAAVADALAAKEGAAADTAALVSAGLQLEAGVQGLQELRSRRGERAMALGRDGEQLEWPPAAQCTRVGWGGGGGGG